jgi:hypothetical protein
MVKIFDSLPDRRARGDIPKIYMGICENRVTSPEFSDYPNFWFAAFPYFYTNCKEIRQGLLRLKLNGSAGEIGL